MKKKRTVSLTMRIIALFCAVIIVACVIISLIVYRAETDRQLEAVGARGATLLRSMAQDIETRAAQVEIITQELAFDKSVISLLNTKSVGPYIVKLLFSVEERINISEPYLADLDMNLLLLAPLEGMPESYDVVVDQSWLADNPSYQAFLKSDKIASWGPVEHPLSFSAKTADVVPYNYKIGSGLRNSIGTVRSTVNAQKLFRCLKAEADVIGLSVIRERQVIYSVGDDAPAIERFGEDGQIMDGSILYLQTTLASMDMSLLMALDLSAVYSASIQNVIIIVAAVFLTGLCLLGSTILIVRKMLDRLNRMTEAVRQIPSGGALAFALPAAGPDEAGQLSAAFSSLLDRVNAYYTRLLDEEKSKRYAQRMALQYQINPHFLYNSLYWLQLENEGIDLRLSDAIAQLGTVLHYNLEGSFRAMLSEEERQIRAYVSFMSAMKNDQILLKVITQPAMENYWILRFSLQPLLENAISHGYRASSPLRLEVAFTEDPENNHFFITISNDGSPIEPSRLKELQTQLKSKKELMGKGVGLINLKRRLELTYGERSDLCIMYEDPWTRFRLTLPLDAVKKGEP